MSQDKRPTMNDVAARAGVSRALVSIVMREAPGASDATRTAVLAAADELGYSRDEGARSLRTGRSDLVGVVFDIRDDFHAGLVEALYPAAASRGSRLSLSAVTRDRDQEAAIAALVDQRVDGIVVLGSRAPVEVMEEVAARTPVVVVGRWAAPVLTARTGHTSGASGSLVRVVRTDERAGVHDAVDHLVVLGHSAINCVEATGHPAGAERTVAYREAMQRHGLSARIRIHRGAFTHRAGREAGEAILRSAQNRPSAVLAANDTCALGLVQTLRAAGVDVPGQVSVVGFDGSQLSSAPDLDLTTVAQDRDGLAGLAVASLVAAQVREHVLRPRLHVGQTTATAAVPAPAVIR